MSAPTATRAPTPIAARAGAILAAILVLGCQAAAVQPRSSSPAATNGTGSVAPTATPGSAPGISIPEPGSAATTPAPPAPTCAAEVHTAEKLPLDLLLLVDAS